METAAEPDAIQQSSDRPPSSLWTPEWRRLTIGLVVLVTLAASEALAVATVLPLVAHDLHGLALYGWVTSAFFLGALVGLVVAGDEVDRRGPAMPYAVALVLFAAGLLVAGLAPSMAVVVAGRLLQGLGAGAIPAIAYASIGRTIPESLRPRVFAWLSTAWVLPGIAGPAGATAIASLVGWRGVFLALLPLVAITSVLPYRALRRVGPPSAPHPAGTRVIAAVRVAVAAGFALAALQQRSLVSLPLLAGACAVAWRALPSLFPAGTATARRGAPAVVLVRGLLTFGFFGADTFVPLTLVSVRHQPTALAGAALASSTLMWTAGAWLLSHFVAERGARLFVRVGLLILVTGIAATATTLLEAVPAWIAICTWGVSGLGIGLAYSGLSLMMLSEAEPGREGKATASLQLAENLAVAFGAGIGGAAVAVAVADGDAAAGVAVAFAIAAAGALAGLAASGRLPRGGEKPARPRGDDLPDLDSATSSASTRARG
jgi:MFS family permease